MRTMHLFAGAGGGLLADLILGHQPVAAVEWDRHCCRVLRKRAADGWFPGLYVHEIDVRLFDPSGYAGRVDCIHAGFPCTDISVAGKGAGIDGEASGLWREVARVAGVVRPRYLFLENSPAIVTRGIERVLADLAALGYDSRWRVLSAADVGAPHERERWWCIAERADANGIRQLQPQGGERDQRRRIGNVGQEIPDAVRSGRQELHSAAVSEEEGQHPRLPDTRRGGNWWNAEPDVGRVAHGVAARMDRLRAIGNGQVPLCAAAAWIALGGPVETNMILRLRAVEALTGISRATIYRMIQAGTFPKQVQVSPGAVGWHAEEIDAWVASRPAAGTHTGTQSANLAAEPA